MKNYLYALFAGSLLFTACGEEKTETPEQTNGVLMEYKFHSGDDFYVTLNWNEVIQPLDSTTKRKADTVSVASTYKYHIDHVNENGQASVTITYDRLKTGEFDSKDSTTYNSREGMMFASMMNYVMKAKIDKKGNLTELSGGDDFFTFGQPDTLVDDNKCIEADLNQFFHVLPENMVNIGDTWETSHTIHFGYPGKYKTVFKLLEVKDDIAVVELSGQMTENPDGLTVFPGGFVLKQYFSGTRKGTIRFDLKTGMPTNSGYTDAFSGKSIGTMQGKNFMIQLKVNLSKNFDVKLTKGK